MYEDSWQFKLRHQSNPEVPSIQNVCSPYYALWIPTLVLQPCSHVISAPMSYHLKILGKMQRRAAIWILGAFKTSLSFGIETIARLIPINLYLQKLGGRSQLQVHSLPPSHLIQFLMDSSHNASTLHHPASLNSLTSHQ